MVSSPDLSQFSSSPQICNITMADPLMLAMRQSGIIDSSQSVKQKQIKMSTVLIPKRTIKTSRSRQIERLSSGVGKKINRNTSGSTIKPENYDLIDPVLRRIFAGTFHTASFNVQVR